MACQRGPCRISSQTWSDFQNRKTGERAYRLPTLILPKQEHPGPWGTLDYSLLGWGCVASRFAREATPHGVSLRGLATQEGECSISAFLHFGHVEETESWQSGHPPLDLTPEKGVQRGDPWPGSTCPLSPAPTLISVIHNEEPSGHEARMGLSRYLVCTCWPPFRDAPPVF